MKYFSLTLFAVFSLSAFSQSILLKGGMVHSGTGAEATLQDILISGNEIARIGKNLTINGKTQVIELNGLPSLVSTYQGYLGVHQQLEPRIVLRSQAIVCTTGL